jgi:hypothetical protein
MIPYQYRAPLLRAPISKLDFVSKVCGNDGMVAAFRIQILRHQSFGVWRKSTPLPCLALGPACKFRNNCPLGPSDLLLVELCDVARW